jgi:hypothetical protein
LPELALGALRAERDAVADALGTRRGVVLDDVVTPF